MRCFVINGQCLRSVAGSDRDELPCCLAVLLFCAREFNSGTSDSSQFEGKKYYYAGLAKKARRLG